jgi:ABC-2 type transport system ATP-binding protein
MSPIIQVDQLGKTYQVPEREAGLGAAVRSLFQRKYREVKAVENISFEIAPGEVVGLLEPPGTVGGDGRTHPHGRLYPYAGATQYATPYG